MSEELSPVSKIVGNILSKDYSQPSDSSSYTQKNPSRFLHKNDACCSADLVDFLDENVKASGMFQGRIISDETKDVVMNVYSFFENFSRKGAGSLTSAACKINKEQHINYVYVSGSAQPPPPSPVEISGAKSLLFPTLLKLCNILNGLMKFTFTYEFYNLHFIS